MAGSTPDGASIAALWVSTAPSIAILAAPAFNSGSSGYLLDSASPTKVPEYLALGVPVVCNDNPDQERVINESGAGICVPYSAEDFASAVIKMLCLDKSERNEMGIKGKDYVSRYRDYRIIGNDVANSYRSLLS